MVAEIMSSTPQPPRLRGLAGGALGRAESKGLNEEALLRGVVEGDQRVAVEFYHRMLPSVEGALLRVLGRRETDHEDLVQASFEQIVKTLATGKFAGACSLKTWSSTIAANTALKSLRTRVRRRRMFAPSLPPVEVEERASTRPTAEQDASRRNELEVVRQQLARLAAPKAEAVMLHDVLGHGLSEIATMTGCSVAAAQTRLSRGRRELAKLLDEALPAGEKQ